MSSGLRHVPLEEGLVEDGGTGGAEVRPAEAGTGGATGEVSSKRVCSRWAYAGAATLVAFGIAIALIVTLSGSSPPDGCGWDSWRLPQTFTPRAYRWTVYPEFGGDYGFNGTIEIDATAETSNAGCVVLNAVDLDIHEASLVSGAGERVTGVTHRKERQLVLVHLARIPAKGDGLTLRLSYSGSLNRNMEGLYLSTFKEGGDTVPMVATQFESTAARRAFPCFDEPAFKATFSVTVQNVPDGYVALANTPEDAGATKEASGALGRRAVAFEPTPRMSTYLVAMVVGPLSSVSGETAPAGEGSHSIGVKVWARRGMEDKLQFALGTAIRVLEFFQRFYRVPYPLAKVDMVAIPDFAAGAMENWGLVTYRETALLTNATTSSVSSQLRVAIVVAHELGHQWFGNLVTMEWWDELWLNEGFASFMEFKGAAHARPSLSPWDGFIPDTWSRALDTDSYASTHPLRRADVVSPGQIEEQFDDISYAKGASVIRMVASYCEEQKLGSFAEGLHQYLTAHAYGNAESGDLWHALAGAADLPNLPADMKSQTYEPGFPLVSVEVESHEEEGKAVQHLVMTQQRFFHSEYSREQAPADQRDILWWVPIVYKTEHGERSEPTTVPGGMRDRGLGERILYEPGKDGFLKVNPNATAYFRTMYPAPVWQRLRSYMLQSAPVERRGGRPFFGAAGKLTADDRAQLVDDLWASTLALVAHGNPRIGSGLTAGDAVSFLDILRCELSYTVWVPALRHLGHLDSMLHPDTAPTAGFQPSPELAAVTKRAAELLEPALGALGWEPGAQDLPSTALLRDRLLRAGSYFNVSSVVKEAWRRWRQWQDSGDASGVQAGALRTVAESVVRWGRNETWQAVRRKYEEEADPYRRSTLLTALVKAREPALLQQTLAYAMGPHVRKQDKTYLISSVAANPMGRALAWQFFENNFAALEDIYGGGGFALSGLVTSVAGHFATRGAVERINAFFKANPLPAAELETERAREAIEARILFRNHGSALASVVNATRAPFGPECTGTQCAACHTS